MNFIEFRCFDFSVFKMVGSKGRLSGDVARPLSYKTKTAYFLKTIKLLTQDLKNVSLQKKIRPVMPALSSHAGIMPVTEKNLLITGFIQN